jgi:DNA-binding winged helix-turn-helix (wHTH) protein
VLAPEPAPPSEAPRIDEAEADRLYAAGMAAARRVARVAVELEHAAAHAPHPGWQLAAASCRRAEASLRRCAEAVPEVPPDPANADLRRVIVVGPLSVDRQRRVAFWAGAPLGLTRLGFDLLVALAERSGEVVTKQELLRSVWGYAGPVTRTRTVDSHASRLRRTLAEAGANGATIVNVWAIGYRLAVAEQDGAA